MTKFSTFLLASFLFFVAQGQQKATITINVAKAPKQKGNWYDITLQVGYHRVDCYLDGKL